MKRTTLLALALALTPTLANAASVTVIGRLIDRQCSVEDLFQVQPAAEKYCTLTFEESRVVGSVTYRQTFTVYCPNRLTINGSLFASYETCSDPAALQVRHPTRTYSVSGVLRTDAEQADGRGQVIASGMTY